MRFNVNLGREIYCFVIQPDEIESHYSRNYAQKPLFLRSRIVPNFTSIIESAIMPRDLFISNLHISSNCLNESLETIEEQL